MSTTGANRRWKRRLVVMTAASALLASKQIGYAGNGWLGQHLVIYPEREIVAVRMRHGSASPTEEENKQFGLLRFPFLVAALFAERK
jgi:hypothetical protein